MHPKVQGLHTMARDWWTALQQATQTTTVCGPSWTQWCPAIPICVPASYSQSNMAMPKAFVVPWAVDLGSFPQDQKKLVLLASAQHTGGAVLILRSKSDHLLDPASLGLH
jgi:hypothetical protein